MAPVVGVCFYQKESLPGYSAIFRHPNDELNFCYYLIPYGKEGYCGDVKVRVTTFRLYNTVTDICGASAWILSQPFQRGESITCCG